MHPTTTVGQKIAAIRERKRMRLADLAARSGLAASTISRIENGLRTPSYGALEKIAGAFGCGVRDLIPSKRVA